jgi:hypothetical protein
VVMIAVKAAVFSASSSRSSMPPRSTPAYTRPAPRPPSPYNFPSQPRTTPYGVPNPTPRTPTSEDLSLRPVPGTGYHINNQGHLVGGNWDCDSDSDSARP